MNKIKVSFQGVLGAYSHLAVIQLFPKSEMIPCETFDDACNAVVENKADYAVLPIENSTAGRVTGIHRLMPNMNLYVVGEYYLPVSHCLLASEGTKLEEITHVYSHEQALAQCARNLKKMKITPHSYLDTSGAAKMVAEKKEKGAGALASSMAAEMYGLTILQYKLQDLEHNTTRFLILSSSQIEPEKDILCKTAFIFQVRSIPAALYKALGGFATNGVNITKLESYMEGKDFSSTKFFVEIEGHVKHRLVALAFEELKFFSQDLKILGTFPREK